VAPVNAASLPIAAPQQSLSAAALPADPVALLRRVAALADQGSYPEAASLCRDLLRADPNQAPAYYWLGVIAQAQTRVTAAEEFFHKAIYLDPRHYEALVHLALLREGRGDSTGATLLRQRAQRALQGVSLA
jgi:chemotaxis protein methyltransferase WspC